MLGTNSRSGLASAVRTAPPAARVAESAVVEPYAPPTGSAGCLGPRQQRERAFHDAWAAEVDQRELDPIRRAFCPTTPETTYALRSLGDLEGRQLLDLGCGAGETTAWLALQGAWVDGVDISSGMIAVARDLVGRLGVAGRVGLHVAPGEALPFRDGRFDRVFGHDCLHHMDFDRARGEIQRVLKPGGRAVFVEPLGHNPLINHFRDISPRTRTPDETPLRFSDFRRLKKGFRSLRHREYQFSTLALFLWFYVVERSDPNEVRYWKKIIVEAEKYRPAFVALDWIDRAMLTFCPPAGRLCRVTVIVMDR
jgi:ubiquinone/menaquinone biosynthesis C-methylase UbiE